METLAVPEVFELPRLAPNKEDAVGFADMVLTALLGCESGVLRAEYCDPGPSVGWFITSPGLRDEHNDVPVAVSPSGGAFRSVLARFGHHYMGDQLYNGYALRFLSQRGRVHRCHIYMSNTSQSGFWIEVYAAKTAEPTAGANAAPPRASA